VTPTTPPVIESPTPTLSPTLFRRFWSKVLIGDGCWVWQGALTNPGYARVWAGDKMKQAHNLSYETLVGPIPDGLELDHLCRNRACVRPDHLEPVSRRTNILRGHAPTARNALAVFCVRGHPFDAANTWRSPDGRRRRCRTCTLERKKRVRLLSGTRE
jgi:HNH endonuclease